MADYFPLLKGLRLEYEHTGSEFEGTEKIVIEILSIKKQGNMVVAQTKMTVELKGKTKVLEYKIHRTPNWISTDNGIVIGGRKEFPLPPTIEKKWDDRIYSCTIDSLTEQLSVPAGQFKNCLKVSMLIAGGDAGSGVRYYAPDIGYIYEEYSGEERGDEVRLVSIKQPSS
jgi:hypothetical protein